MSTSNINNVSLCFVKTLEIPVEKLGIDKGNLPTWEYSVAIVSANKANQTPRISLSGPHHQTHVSLSSQIKLCRQEACAENLSKDNLQNENL